ncbi:MAG: hypothetical protein K2O49_08370, partial [Muribaculaceae bacterium]|nr:hypothetical protein [Muribaculaceae bacterium]
MKGKRLRFTFKAALMAALLLFGATYAGAAEAPLPVPKSKKTTGNKKANMNNQRQSNTFNSPDFAFPETVEKNARGEWKEALERRDGLKGLQAGLQLVVANNLISRDNFNRNIEMLDSAVRVMPPVYASLFRLLQADLYTALYNRDRWTYNQRVLPVDSFPADPRSWSKDLFAKKVLQLVMLASDNPAESRKMPISDITSVLTDYKTMAEAGCSVNDFIIFKSTSILDTFSGREEGTIPFGNQITAMETGFPAKCSALSRSLIDTLVTYRSAEGNDAALSLAVVRKSEFLPDGDKLKFLKEWKDRLIDSPADARILTEYYNNFIHRMPEDKVEERALYAQMQKWVERFPSATGSDAVRYCVASMKLPQMNFKIPSQILPGTDIKAEVTIENATKGYLLIYGISPEAMRTGSFNVSKFPGNGRFIKAVPVDAEGEIPFTEKVEVNMGSLPAGYYVVVPSPSATLSSNWKGLVDRWSLQPLNVSEITIFTNYDSSQPESGKVYVVKAANQQPVKGASLTIWGNNDKVIKSGVTAADGSFPLPQGYSRVTASHKGSNAEAYTGYYASKREIKPEVRCNILTDLSIYKPGDEVSFVLVEWLSDKNSNRLLTDEPVEVVMRDANWNPVDTLSLRTDSDGRVSGSFGIPKTGLLGSYSLTAASSARGRDMISRVFFQVADYKTPTFIVSLEKEGAGSYEAGDTISFKGSVKTYSGMPLGGAKVTYKVTWQPWWRWGGDYSNASYGGTLDTDSEGNFKIELPTANLKGTRYEHGLFTITADATSTSGETQNAPDIRFSLGKDYSVHLSFPDRICVESDSIRLNMPVYDILGLPVIKNVDYRIERIPSSGSEKGELVKEGKFTSPVLELPASLFPSGKYNISVCLEGDTLKAERDLVIFRKDDKLPPYPVALWIPENTYLAQKGSGTVDVKFGSGYADSWILAVVTGPEGIISREWINLGDENRILTVPAPADGTNTRISFSGMHDFDQALGTITVEPESARRKLEVKASSFRDRITAGSK